MANNATFTLKLEVDASGNLKLAENQVRRLGKAVRDTGNAQAEANKKAEDAYSTQNKGVIGTANSSKSFSKLTQTIGNGSNGLVGAYAALAANAFAVSAAFNTLNSAAQTTALLQGLEAQGARTGKTLSILSGRLQEITKNSISATDAMRATAQGSTSGIAAADMEKLTKVAYEASLALGRDVPDSLNRMMLAVTKMEPELVDELGLTTKITEASEKYARQNGITVGSMTQMQKQQALLNAWVEQGTLKFGGLAEEVDPNPYNQLAATFNNLVKSGLGVVNVLLKPLVSFLASSQGVLLGFATLFVSSIKGQIMPGLQDASKQALKSAEANKQAAITELEGQKTLAAGKRKAINEYINAAKQGQATQAQFDAAQKESEARQATLEASNTKNAALRAKRIEEEKKRRADLASIQQHQAKITLEEARAQGYAASEDVNLTNAKQKLGDTVKAMANSFQVSYDSVQKGETVLGKIQSTATATGKGILAAGKVAAIGFINFLPVIGQVIAAVSILWEWVGRPIFNKLTGRTEEVTKALENFETVIESTTKKVEALGKMEVSTAAAADRAVAIIKNQTSTIYEVADAYIAVYEAKRKVDAEDTKSEERTKARIELQKKMAEASRKGDSEALKKLQDEQRAMNAASRLGVSETSSAAVAFQSEASGLWLSDSAEKAAQYLDTLEQRMPSVAKAFYAAQGGAAAFNKLPTDEKLRRINESAILVSGTLKKVESGFDSLSNSIQGINTGYTDFIKSITPTTPYDAITDKFKAFSTSLYNVKDAIREAGDMGSDTKDLNNRLAETIGGFKGDARNIFTLDVQANMGAFDDIDSKLQMLKERQSQFNEGTDQYKKLANEITPMEEKRNKLMASITPEIEKQASEYNVLLLNAQRESIEQQGLLAVAQARLGVIQKQGIVTGADVERQMRAENAIIALQQAQLRTQLNFVQIDIKKKEARLEEIKDTIRLLDLQRNVTSELDKQRFAQEKAALQAKIRLAEEDPSKAGEAALARQKMQAIERAEKNADVERARQARAAAEAEADINKQRAQAKTLAQQIAALGMGANSEAEIKAARIKKDLENEKESNDIVRETKAIKNSILITEQEIGNMLTKNTSTIAIQAEKINEAGLQRRKSLTQEWQFRQQMLTIDRNLAQNRGLTEQVKYYNNLLDVEEKRYNASIKQVDVEERRDTLQLALVKSTEEEIGLKQNILDIQQKLASAIAESMSAQVAYNAAVLSLDAKKRGISNSEAVQNSKAIDAAKAAYDLAVAEFELKKTAIELEFRLLNAKRLMAIKELGDRLELLQKEKKSIQDKLGAASLALQKQKEQTPKEGELDPQGSIVVTANLETDINALTDQFFQVKGSIDIVSDAISALTGITTESIDGAMSKSVEALKTRLKTLGLGFQEALTVGPRTKDSLLTQFNEIGAIADNWTKRREEILKYNEENAGKKGFKALELPTEGALAIDMFTSHFEKMKESLAALGPQGEIVSALSQSAITISNTFIDTFAVIGQAGASAEAKVAAIASAVSAVLGSVMSILNATTNAKIANIDKEIAAEEKRDGKSRESVTKLEAMEKKKDAIARKAFNTNKKLMLAQAVMSTAAGVAGVLAHSWELGPVLTPILAGMIGAMGLAQVAIIAGTQYESSYSPKSIQMPSTLSIGKRSDTVNLASGPNANAGGEAGYIRGAAGYGSNAGNYNTIGSAYGGDLTRGYGNRGFIVGEKGPELITPETPINVTPANENIGGAPVNATFNIQAIDSQGVQDVLVAQKGNIIQMLRQAANASGQRFLEDVNVNVYTRPSVGKLL